MKAKKTKKPVLQKLDSYGYPVTSNSRHHKCRCDVPCQKLYACDTCNKLVPWCDGVADGMGDSCDDCWAKKQEKVKKMSNDKLSNSRAARIGEQAVELMKEYISLSGDDSEFDMAGMLQDICEKEGMNFGPVIPDDATLQVLASKLQNIETHLHDVHHALTKHHSHLAATNVLSAADSTSAAIQKVITALTAHNKKK